MITFALPWVLAVAGASAMVVAALHWLSVRRPPERVLPTARFLPNHDVRAVSRTTRPSDLLLLLLRVLLILLAGVAIAGPAWRPSTRRTGTVVVVGVGVARDTLGIRELVMRPGANADAPLSVVFAEAANQGSGTDRARAATGTALFPLAVRAARNMVRGDVTIDSLDVHLVMPSPVVDSAVFDAWRTAWSGRVTLHSVSSLGTSSRETPSSDMPSRVAPRAVYLLDDARQRFDARTVATRSAAHGADVMDDVVTTALAWHAARVGEATAGRADTVQLVRRDASAARARIQIEWPETGVPTTWRALDAADTAWAVAIGGDVIDGPWVVSAQPDTATGGRAMAWFSNGAVAATETRSSSVCVRRVALVANTGSDVLLSPAANVLFDRLLAPCDSAAEVVPATLTERSVYGSALASAGFLRDGERGAVTARSSPNAWLTPLLLGLSLLMLFVEWWARGRRGGNAVAQEPAPPGGAYAGARASGAT